MDASRRLQCFGPCTEYGDLRPEGVARVRVDYKPNGVRSIIALDYAEALMLKRELDGALLKIENNRRAFAAESIGD